MRLFPLLAVICGGLMLQGCIGAAVIGSAAVATKSATDPGRSANKLTTVH